MRSKQWILSALCILAVAGCGGLNPKEHDIVQVLSADGVPIPLFELGESGLTTAATLASGSLVEIGYIGKGVPKGQYLVTARSGRRVSGMLMLKHASCKDLGIRLASWPDPSQLPPPPADIPNFDALAAAFRQADSPLCAADDAGGPCELSEVEYYLLVATLNELQQDRRVLVARSESLPRGEYETTDAYTARKSALVKAGTDSLVAYASALFGRDLAGGAEVTQVVPIAEIVSYNPDSGKMAALSEDRAFSWAHAADVHLRGMELRRLRRPLTDKDIPVYYGGRLLDALLFDEVFANVNIDKYKAYHDRVRCTLGRENELAVGIWSFEGPAFAPEDMPRFAQLADAGDLVARVRSRVSFRNAAVSTALVAVDFGSKNGEPCLGWTAQPIPITYNTGRTLHDKLLVERVPARLGS